MVPKFYAIDRAEAVARRVARPLQAFSALFHPLIVALTAVADRILRLLGVDMSLERRGGSSEELKLLIAESHEGGQIDQGEAGMLRGVFHLHEQEARQVMTPSPAVVTVDISQDVETALRLCVSSGHTRLLVTEEEDRDRVRGIAHVSELVRQLMQDGAAHADRAGRPRRADRARDQAAGRPARRPAAPAHFDGGGRGRVRPGGGRGDRRGHHRGGGGGDRRRDRPSGW